LQDWRRDFLRDGFESAGEIRLIDAEIGGQLACNGAKLNASGDALCLDQAKIRGGVFLVEGFECAGEVRMISAEIDRDLNCRGAKLTASGGCSVPRRGQDLRERFL
jgi:hypothetical protein